MHESTVYFVVRVRCRCKQSSRSLSVSCYVPGIC